METAQGEAGRRWGHREPAQGPAVKGDRGRHATQYQKGPRQGELLLVLTGGGRGHGGKTFMALAWHDQGRERGRLPVCLGPGLEGAVSDVAPRGPCSPACDLPAGHPIVKAFPARLQGMTQRFLPGVVSAALPPGRQNVFVGGESFLPGLPGCFRED